MSSQLPSEQAVRVASEFVNKAISLIAQPPKFPIFLITCQTLTRIHAAFAPTLCYCYEQLVGGVPAQVNTVYNMGFLDKSSSSHAVNGLNLITRFLQFAFGVIVLGIVIALTTFTRGSASNGLPSTTAY